MSPRRRRFVGRLSALMCALTTGAAVAGDVQIVGRVELIPVRVSGTTSWDALATNLEERYAPASGDRFSSKRLISLRPSWGDPTRFEATVYDYATERTYELTLDAEGNELARRVSAEQPSRSLEELADAYAVVRGNPRYAQARAKGELGLYEAMPPVTVDGLGRRLVNVGVMSPSEAGQPVL